MPASFRILLLFLLAACFGAGNAMAQNQDQATLQRTLSGLKQQKNYLADTGYAHVINLIAAKYALTAPDSAIAILSDHTQRYTLSGYEKGEMDAYQILGNAYLVKGNYKAALEQTERAYNIAVKTKNRKAIASIEGDIGSVYLNQGNYQKALLHFYQSQKTAEQINDRTLVSSSLNNIGTVQFYQGNMDEAEQAYVKTLAIAKDRSDTFDIALAYNNLGEVKIEKKEFSKALAYLTTAYQFCKLGNIPELEAPVSNSLGTTYFAMGNTAQALASFDHALTLARKLGKARAYCKALLGLAKVYKKEGRLDAALTYGLEGLQKAEEMGQTQLLRDANEIVADIYEARGDGNLAIQYFRKFKFFSDSLVNIENERVAANYKADFEYSQKELVFERKSAQQRWLIFLSVIGLVSLLVILFVINRNRKRMSKANTELQQKGIIIEEQKAKAEKTLSHLRTTQNQLIQSEKMASLGELAAGIAHEIQNPLNFVNNFSEVSKELLQEMKQEMDMGNTAVADEIALDVIQNLEKIRNHGKRADAIVKGMLQHSRNSNGKKEPADINALVDEYVKLSYFGLRAKDNTFNTKIKTSFDRSIPLINIIPQDIGRVILNILTNAFYAVEERKKQNPEDYEPLVSVTTRNTGEQVAITITDNANGIPAALMGKIFQPFFTTKPSGQGTGLGLSLSFDIVTKGHGGILKVSSVTESDQSGATGTTFIIQLPL